MNLHNKFEQYWRTFTTLPQCKLPGVYVEYSPPPQVINALKTTLIKFVNIRAVVLKFLRVDTTNDKRRTAYYTIKAML